MIRIRTRIPTRINLKTRMIHDGSVIVSITGPSVPGCRIILGEHIAHNCYFFPFLLHFVRKLTQMSRRIRNRTTPLRLMAWILQSSNIYSVPPVLVSPTVVPIPICHCPCVVVRVPDHLWVTRRNLHHRLFVCRAALTEHGEAFTASHLSEQDAHI